MCGRKRLGRLHIRQEVAQDRLRDARAGLSVAIGVDGLGHTVIGGRVVEQLGGQAVGEIGGVAAPDAA